MNLGDLVLRVRPDEAAFRRDMGAVAERAGDESGQTLGQRLGAGLKMAVPAAGATLGLFVASGAQEFAAFQHDMNEVFTLLPGISKDAMAEMTGQVKDFANEFGVLPDEIIPALYQSLSAGVPQDNLFTFLETANKLAVAGVASRSQAVNVLTGLTAAYGDTSEEAQKHASDLLLETVRLGKTNLSELEASLGKVAPKFNALGISQEQLLASSAALFGVTGNTSEVLTQQGAVVTALIAQNPAMTAALKAMGYETSQAAIESLGYVGVLKGLEDQTDGNLQMFQSMLGSSEAVTAALALTGARAQVAADNLATLADTGGETDAAFARMDSGITAVANRITARLRTLAIDVGAAIEPIAPLFVAFGPTLGRALGAAFGAGFGLLARSLPRLMGPVLARMATVVAGPALGGSIVEAAAGIYSRLAAQALQAGTTVGMAFSSAFRGAVILGVALAGAYAAQEIGKFARSAAQDFGEAFGLDLEFDVPDLRNAARQAMEALAQGFGISLEEFTAEYLAPARVDEMVKRGLLDPVVAASEDARDRINEVWRSLGAREQLEIDDAALRAAAGRLSTMGVVFEDAGEGIGEDFGEGIGTGLADGMRGVGIVEALGDVGDLVHASLRRVLVEIPEAIRAANREAAHEARLLGPSLRDGIRSGRQAVRQAMADLRWAMEHPMREVKVIAQIEGALTSKRLREGLSSGQPGVRREAQRQRSVLIEQWEQMTGESWDFGASTSENLAGGIRSRRRAAREAARETKAAAKEEIDKAPAAAETAGEATSTSFASGIMSFLGRVTTAAAALAQELADNSKPGSPTKKGPLSKDGGMEGWGRRLAMDFRHGLEAPGGVDLVSALGLQALDPLSVTLQGSQRHTELIRSSTDGGHALGARGGDTYSVTTYGLPMRAETPREVVQELRRSARMGIIAPRRRRGWEPT